MASSPTRGAISSDQNKLKGRSSSLSKSPVSSAKKNISQCICLICEKAIIDASPKSKGQDSVFCEGTTCQGWIHRTCAGLTKSQFRIISSPQHKSPFYCLQCTHARYSEQISQLSSTIEILNKKIANLELAKVSESVNATSPSYADIVNHQAPRSFNSNESHESIPDLTPLSQTAKIKSKVPNSDRRYNLVVYGVKECAPGTNRHTRLIHDNNEIAKMVNKINPDIPVSSIRDCTRLGKFSDDRCRPILTKMTRTCDVSSILSQRNKLRGSGFLVKPDLSKEARQIDKLLMKFRWDLIQLGVKKGDIRIRGNSLYVNNVKKGHIVDGKLIEDSSIESDFSTHPQDDLISPSLDQPLCLSQDSDVNLGEDTHVPPNQTMSKDDGTSSQNIIHPQNSLTK